MAVRNVNDLTASDRVKAKLSSEHSRFGWHFHYYGESLLVSPDLIANLIDFYSSNPNRRGEIADGSILNRIEEMTAKAV